MGLRYDDAGLAAVVMTKIAAKESEGPGQLTARMTELVSELVKRNGPNAATELAIALARQHFTILSAAAQAINVPVTKLLAALEMEQLAGLEDGD
ncbi:hypothetical protein [Arthrobacter sp. R4-81]